MSCRHRGEDSPGLMCVDAVPTFHGILLLTSQSDQSKRRIQGNLSVEILTCNMPSLPSFKAATLGHMGFC